MKGDRKAKVIICCSVLITALMWVWQNSVHPVSPENYSAISGVLKSKEEITINKSVRLRFYIENNPIPFQIPADLYEKSVNRELLFETVHQGDPIDFLADKYQLNASHKRSPESVEPITVHSFKDGNNNFLTLDAQNRIIRDYKASIQISAWMMTVFSIILNVLYFRIIPNKLSEIEKS